MKRILAPTLILVGDKDDYTPPASSHFLHRQIPGSKLIVVEGAGHCLPLEFPEKVNREVTGFLQEVAYGMSFGVPADEETGSRTST
jgi:pimeloyl-ACP methyl ester carboxylesterase